LSRGLFGVKKKKREEAMSSKQKADGGKAERNRRIRHGDFQMVGKERLPRKPKGGRKERREASPEVGKTDRASYGRKNGETSDKPFGKEGAY